MSQVDSHPFLFYIAKDEQGIKDLEYGATYAERLLEIPIAYQDIVNSWDLIVSLNDKLSLLIDIYEDEQIETDMLPKALQIAIDILEKEQNANKKASISKFISAIETAISRNSPLLIWW